VGHCEDEDPLALVARADLSRAEYSCRCSVTHPFQLSEDMEQNGRSERVLLVGVRRGELGADDTLDVFEEHKGGLTLSDTSEDMGEEVSRVLVGKPFTGGTERLAREAAR